MLDTFSSSIIVDFTMMGSRFPKSIKSSSDSLCNGWEAEYTLGRLRARYNQLAQEHHHQTLSFLTSASSSARPFI
jgi:hypothetical protein